MGARRYSPAWRRCNQRDSYPVAVTDLGLTLGALTSNRYAFAGGNPIGYTEPIGHDPCDLFGPLALGCYEATALVRSSSTARSSTLGCCAGGSDTGITSREACREAMRQQGMPTSQQPMAQQGNAVNGRQYLYETTRPGGGRGDDVVTQHPPDPKYYAYWH